VKIFSFATHKTKHKNATLGARHLALHSAGVAGILDTSKKLSIM